MRHTVVMRRGGTPPHPRPRAIALAAAVIALVLAAAATLPDGFVLFGRDRSRGGVVLPDPPAAAAYILAAILALLLVMWIVVHVLGLRSRAARGARRAPPVWIQVLVVLLALILPGLPGVRDLFDRGRDQATESTRDTSPSGEAAEQRSQALGVAVTVLLGLLLAALVAGLTWLFWPEPRRAPPDEEQRAAILEGLAVGLDDLARITEPRAAVISCYARMERLLAAAGVVRRPSDTPLELLARVLRDHRAAEPSVARLTELFERARFSAHRIDETMRRRALAAVSEVRDQIAAAT